MRTFQVGDAVQTRDGRRAEIIRDDLRDDIRPLAAIVTDQDGRQWVSSFGPQGQFSMNEKPEDLVPAPRKRTVWLNVYDGFISAYGSRNVADRYAVYGPGRLARACIEIEEGRFDD